MMDITSIMLVTFNRLELTKRMINNLILTTDSPHRLIVVDNGSTDGTVEWLETKLPANNFISFDFIKNDKNLGIASGRNQCLLAASKYRDPWLSTVDNDIELPNGWLSRCIDVLTTNPKFTIGVNMEHVPYPIVTKNNKTFQYKAQGNLGSACMVFNVMLHQAIGFFTTAYDLYGEEDANWGARLRQAGYEMGYIEEMGNHFGQGDLDVGPYRQFKDECRGKNIAQFREDCRLYSSGEKSIYIPFSIKQMIVYPI